MRYHVSVMSSVFMCCHVSCGSRYRFTIKVGSGTTTCITVLDIVSLPRWALTPSRVLWLRISPPYRDGLRHCNISHGSEPRLPELWRCYVPSNSLLGAGLKNKERRITRLCVLKACSRVFKTHLPEKLRPTRRAERRHHQDLQDVRKSINNTTPT
jgi:hypothetical protein